MTEQLRGGGSVEAPLLSSSSNADYHSVDGSDSGVWSASNKSLRGNMEVDVLPETSTLGRSLNWRSAYILTISRVLGSGIFATPGVILTAVGSPALALTLWVLGACIAYFALTVSLEYGCMLPRSGGEKVYLEFTYRRPKYLASILVATQAILLGFTASNCIVFAQYTLFAFGYNGTELVRKVIAVGLLTWITLVHACFKELGIKIQDFLGWIKIVLLIFMIFSGLFVVLFRPSLGDQSETIRTQSADDLVRGSSWWEGSVWSLGVLAPALFKVLYSFAGLNNVTNVMNEVENPVRTLRSVTLTALATSASMYLLINVAYFLVVPAQDVKISGELISALFFQRVFGDTIGRRFLPLMVALSGVGNVMVVTFALARLNQEIARTGLIPFSQTLSSTAPFGSPLGGLLLHYIPSVLVITIPSGDIYSFILEVEGYPTQFFSIATCVGLLILRHTRSDLERPYKAFLPGVIIQIVINVALVLAPFFPSETQRSSGGLRGAGYAVVGIAILGSGVIYWYAWTIALPNWRGYKLEEQVQVLSDGTTVTKLIHIPQSA